MSADTAYDPDTNNEYHSDGENDMSIEEKEGDPGLERKGEESEQQVRKMNDSNVTMMHLSLRCATCNDGGSRWFSYTVRCWVA